MVNIIRTPQNTNVSPPRGGEVGEIDTRAPFKSVRAAVSLFAKSKPDAPEEKAVSTKKSKPETEGVLDKEAQYHLARKIRDKYKQQLKNAENAAAEALPQLEKAMRTLQDLKDRVNASKESKQGILEATEELKQKAKKLEDAKSAPFDNAKLSGSHHEVEVSREQYRAAVADLDAAKQELSNLRGDFNAVIELKLVACQRVEETQQTAEAHSEKVKELSEQIETLQESLAEVKLAAQEALQDQANILAQKDADIQSRREAKEEAEKKLMMLQQEMNDALSQQEMESKLAETNAEIEVLKEKVAKVKASLLDAERITAFELVDAKETLKNVEEEKVLLQGMVDSLRLELEDVRKGIADIKNNETDAESLVGRLQAELQQKKTELQATAANDPPGSSDSREMMRALEQVFFDTKILKQEAEKTKKSTKEMQREAKKSKAVAAEMERKLSAALKEAEEAKEANRRAQDMMNKKGQGEKPKEPATTSAEHEGKTKERLISAEEHKALTQKLSDCQKTTEKKIEAVMVQVAMLSTSKMETEKKIDGILREIEQVTVATAEAIKQAESAEAARRVVDNELQRRRQQEQLESALTLTTSTSTSTS